MTDQPIIDCPFCTRPCRGHVGMWSHVVQMHREKLELLRIIEKPKQTLPWEQERAELLERIYQLQAEVYRSDWVAPPEFRLTRQESQFVACLLAKPGARSHDFILSAISNGNTWSDSRLSQVIACKVRRKLKPWSIDIVRNWGLGYGLHERDRQRLLNWNKPAEDIAA